MQDIIIRHLNKSYGGNPVLKDLSALIPAGKLTAVMAPSGTGKTTLLRILAGLEKPDSGEITGLSGLRVSMVFQEDRLIDSLDAAANIRITAPGLTEQETEKALIETGLAEAVHQKTSDLSGGMKRRVAVLRALLARYDLLLLDEPFTGLDTETKEKVIRTLLQRAAGKTVILVTHDPADAERMHAAEKIMIMH